MNLAALPDELLDLIVTAYIGLLHADLNVPVGVPPPGYPDEWENLTRRPPFTPPPAAIFTAAHLRALAPLAATCRAFRSAVARSVTGLSLGLAPPRCVPRLAASADVAADAPPRPHAAAVAGVTADLAATAALLRRLPRLTHLTVPLHVDAPAPGGPRDLAAGVWETTTVEDRQGWLFFVWSVGLLDILPTIQLRSLRLHWQGDSFLAEHPSYLAAAAATPSEQVSRRSAVVRSGRRAPASVSGAAPAAAATPSAAAAPPPPVTGRLSAAPLRSLVLTLRSANRASGFTRSAWARPVGAAAAAHADTLEALVVDAPDDHRYPALRGLLDELPCAPRLVAFATSGALGGTATRALDRVAPGLRALTLGRRSGLTANALRLLTRTTLTGGDGDSSSGGTRPLHLPALEYLDLSSTLAEASSAAYFLDLTRFFATRTFDTLLLSPGLYGPAVGGLLTTALLSLRAFPRSLSIPTPLSDAHVEKLLAASAGRLRRLHLGDTEGLSANGLRALGAAASRCLVHLDVGALDGEALLEAAPALGTVPALVLHVSDWSSACLASVLSAIGSGGATTTVTLRSSVVWAEDFEGPLDWWPLCVRSLVLAGCRGLGSAEAAEVAARLARLQPPATLTWHASFPVW
ncbi:hypothetical protein MMPV_006399 [Pyropia vietnamensis]